MGRQYESAFARFRESSAKMYTVKETNLMPGKQSDLECNGKQFSGDYLMKIGLNVFTAQDGTSHVLVLE